MFLTKSRTISIHEERKNSRKFEAKKYFIPTSFSSQKKSTKNCSSMLKNEDLV